MKKSWRYLPLIILSMLFLSSASYGTSAIPYLLTFDKAYKAINQDDAFQYSYIMGNFTLVHTQDPTLAEEAISNSSQNIDRQSSVYVKIQFRNTDKNKTYTFDVKPVTGSDTKVYYPNSAKKLENNIQDPYWVWQVPAGPYEVNAVVATLNITKIGSSNASSKLFELPITKFYKKKIQFNVEQKEIVYIGDYKASLVSTAYLKGENEIHPYYKYQMTVSNNFNTAKDSFINSAYEKTKIRLKDFKFVSAL